MTDMRLSVKMLIITNLCWIVANLGMQLELSFCKATRNAALAQLARCETVAQQRLQQAGTAWNGTGADTLMEVAAISDDSSPASSCLDEQVRSSSHIPARSAATDTAGAANAGATAEQNGVGDGAAGIELPKNVLASVAEVSAAPAYAGTTGLASQRGAAPGSAASPLASTLTLPVNSPAHSQPPAADHPLLPPPAPNASVATAAPRLPSVVAVISAWHNDIAWIDDLPFPAIVYSEHQHAEINARHRTEASRILHHLCKHYDMLADFTIFFHAHEESWHRSRALLANVTAAMFPSMRDAITATPRQPRPASKAAPSPSLTGEMQPADSISRRRAGRQQPGVPLPALATGEGGGSSGRGEPSADAKAKPGQSRLSTQDGRQLQRLQLEQWRGGVPRHGEQTHRVLRVGSAAAADGKQHSGAVAVNAFDGHVAPNTTTSPPPPPPHYRQDRPYIPPDAETFAYYPFALATMGRLGNKGGHVYVTMKRTWVRAARTRHDGRCRRWWWHRCQCRTLPSIHCLWPVPSPTPPAGPLPAHVLPAGPRSVRRLHAGRPLLQRIRRLRGACAPAPPAAVLRVSGLRADVQGHARQAEGTVP